MYEGDNLDTLEEENPPEESGNRNFWLLGGIMVFLILLSFVGFAVYGLFVIPNQQKAREADQATLVAQQLQVSDGLTQKALEALPTATAFVQPTETPVFLQASPTPTVFNDPQTATVAAANTQAAQAQLTVTALPTSTQLPNTGFFDDAGVPGLFVMALALVLAFTFCIPKSFTESDKSLDISSSI